MKTIQLPAMADQLRYELFEAANDVLTDHIANAECRLHMWDHAKGTIRIEMPQPPHLDVEITVRFDPHSLPEGAEDIDVRFDFPHGAALRLFRVWWPLCA